MTYRAGVIGFGRVGRNHAEAFLAAEEIELGCIADADEELVAEMGELWGVPETHRYHSHSAMLAAEELDAVSIATPDRYHRDHVLDTVRSSADPTVIWCEKPIGTTVREGDESVAACEEADIELVVNHSRQFATAHEALYELLHEEKLLGELRSAHLVAGAEFLNIGTHYVDLLLYLLDTRVSDVRGGCVEPIESGDETRFRGGGTLVMENGTIAHVDPAPGLGNRLSLEGTEGRLSVPLSIARDANGEWHYWSVDESGRTRTPLPEPLEEMWQSDITGTHATYEPGMVPAQPLFEEAARHIVDLIAGRADNASPGSRAVHGLEALVGMLISEETSSRVSLPLAQPFREISLTQDRR